MARAERVPLLAGPPIPTIQASIDGIHYRLGVDTGCAAIVLPPRVARQLHLDLEHPERWDRLAGIGVSAPVPSVRLGKVTVGAANATGLLAYIYDLPPALRIDGLLGLSFLSRYRVTFEFDTRTLVLREAPPRV